MRATHITERMDAIDCDPLTLARTYRDFALVNTAVAGWSLLYRRFLRPVLAETPNETMRLLDIGCGGGDVLQRLVRRARRDGFKVEALGIDPDSRAIDFARSSVSLPGIAFQCMDALHLAETGEQFDIVISNHVLHHLADTEVSELCRLSEQLTRRFVLHNDIHRHPLAYAGFPLIGGLFPGSFILADGMRSIRRSFTPEELCGMVPDGWKVQTVMPFRCVLTCNK